MKNMFKVFVITLTVIFGFSMMACPPEPAGNNGGGDTDTVFTISGSFTAQNADSGNATFYATSTVGANVSANISARALALTEVALEGLLEDGGITFKLKGSYNSETKLYMLSAASSFLRYSISGDVTKTDSKAVVQVNDGVNWISIEINVSASVDGTPPDIDGSGEIADELDNGIPEDMWGVWWGLDSLEKSKGDIIQPGNYYYMLDAYTIKQYVYRHGLWNLEAYTCFFEGATVESNVAKGRVEFTYTDQAAIDANNTDAIQNWWINHLIAYAQAKYHSVPGGHSTDSETIAQVKDDANQGWNKWSDPSWTAVLDKYKGPAQADEGPLGTNQVWNSHFGPDTVFSYTAYRNDAYRIQSGKLQFGRYYAANGTDYFSKNPADITSYTNLKWGASHSRERSDAVGAPPSSQIVTSTSGVFAIPKEVTAIRHNSFESKTNVLQVISGAHWSVLDYALGSYYGKGVKFTGASMDVWVEKDAYVVWQLQLHDGNYPAIAGKWETLEAGRWHTVSLNTDYDGSSFGVASREAVLYLSTMQILRDGSIDGTNYTENTIYIANASITAQQDNTVVVDVLNPIISNLGDLEYGYQNKKWAVWENLTGDKLNLLRSSSTLEINFSNALSNQTINFAWLEIGNNYAWKGNSLIYQGNPSDGVILSQDKKKITVDLGAVVVDRVLLMAQGTTVLIIECQDVSESINELGIISANVSGTTSEFVIDTRDQYHWLSGDLPVSTDNPAGLQIVALTIENITAVKVVNPSLNNVVGYDLGEYKGQEITITFSARVKRVGSAGTLNWQINNSNYPSVPGAAVNNASVNTWHTMGGTWTGIPTAEYPSLYLSTYENNSASTTYYVTDFDIEIVPAEAGEFGAQPDGSFKLNPAGFMLWYGATVTGNSIAFTDGGVYYAYPTAGSFNIDEYNSLEIGYTVTQSGTNTKTDKTQDQATAIVIKAYTSAFVAIAGSGDNYGTNAKYTDLSQSGQATLTINDAYNNADKTFANYFAADGVLGFAIAANTNDTDVGFTVTIHSITFKK